MAICIVVRQADCMSDVAMLDGGGPHYIQVPRQYPNFRDQQGETFRLVHIDVYHIHVHGFGKIYHVRILNSS